MLSSKKMLMEGLLRRERGARRGVMQLRQTLSKIFKPRVLESEIKKGNEDGQQARVRLLCAILATLRNTITFVVQLQKYRAVGERLSALLNPMFAREIAYVLDRPRRQRAYRSYLPATLKR